MSGRIRRHGTHSCYSAGCRLPECRAASTAYVRELRRRNRPARVPSHLDPPRMTAPFAVYAYYDAGWDCLYVGQTGRLRRRHWQHTAHSPWFTDARALLIVADADTREEARAAEQRKISELRPIHNKNGTTATRATRPRQRAAA